MCLQKKNLLKKMVGMSMIAFFMYPAACASVDKTPIRENIIRADSAIDAARKNDASAHAPLALDTAEKKIESARKSFEAGEYRQAAWLAEEALVEAHLAEAKAQSIQTRNMVEELKKTIDLLQNEIDRQQQIQ